MDPTDLPTDLQDNDWSSMATNMATIAEWSGGASSSKDWSGGNDWSGNSKDSGKDWSGDWSGDWNWKNDKWKNWKEDEWDDWKAPCCVLSNLRVCVVFCVTAGGKMDAIRTEDWGSKRRGKGKGKRGKDEGKGGGWKLKCPKVTGFISNTLGAFWCTFSNENKPGFC